MDLSECKSLLQTQLLLARKRPFSSSRKLTVPLIRFLEESTVLLRRFGSIHMTGQGIPLENMLTILPGAATCCTVLSHLTITNAAFVATVSMPNSTCEDYFTFDVSALAYARRLQSLHIHFDRIIQATSRYDTNCGAWLRGMEHCNARDVRIVVESPPFTSLLNDLPP